MNKTRLEALSDGVFSIVMTLLVIEIHVPIIQNFNSSQDLLTELSHLGPLLWSYFVSFVVLSMYWTSHSALFHMFTKTIDRIMVQINMLFLMFISLIPFLAHLLGVYPMNTAATTLYGLHIVIVGCISIAMFKYALYSKEVERHEVSSRLIKQSTTRLVLTPFFALIGILVGLHAPTASFFFFIFPALFNIIPGSLNAAEKIFGFTFK